MIRDDYYAKVVIIINLFINLINSWQVIIIVLMSHTIIIVIIQN